MCSYIAFPYKALLRLAAVLELMWVLGVYMMDGVGLLWYV